MPQQSKANTDFCVRYIINEKSWLYVRGDIFNPDNWQQPHSGGAGFLLN